MSKPLSHDEAIDALCGCAATVTVLSYQEAIEGYFKLRELPIPATPTPEETEPQATVEREELQPPNPSPPRGSEEAGEWVAVPREPTEAMENAGVVQLRKTRAAGGGFGYSMMTAYRAMIAAAPNSRGTVAELEEALRAIDQMATLPTPQTARETAELLRCIVSHTRRALTLREGGKP